MRFPRTDLPIAEDGSGRFLAIMVAVMVFLATLAMSGAMAVQTVVDRWNRDVSGTLTVQVMPAEGSPEESGKTTEEWVEQALVVLRADRAVADAQAIPIERLKALMEPWLGAADLVDDLPMPRLIDVTLKPDTPFDLAALGRRLSEAVPGATLDDHRLWLAKLVNLAEALASLSLAVLVLVTAATSLAVVQATRTAMTTHRPAIEVLHMIGAHDAYIARQFAARSLVLGLIGGGTGLILALPAILGIGYLCRDIEGGFVPDVGLGAVHWLILVCLPLAGGLVAMLTTRVTVLRTLARML
ncbi:cell division protein [Rhodospirillum rubrum]|uniref:cell division protein FtsX n=1 Tax=Rhodospirillum rubrum TaxID=1085 RepID=UPI001905E2D5|nr:FtsX-like permease family protein [Rhodospirillum rubrum]MBK1665546.1 cell division protein [Rhodospirillum rubrum]MBK1678374.1 cell division protein [Rhodospirillum rubrum]